MTTITVNGHQVETGCFVEGHRGQYAPDHLADVAWHLGWPAPIEDDPRYWRRIAEAREANGAPADATADSWEAHAEATDTVLAWLNDRTPDGYIWHWRDGEIFLSPACDDGNCTDDTCAHWD